MKPVIFDGHFGWLHPAEGNRGVVICNPLGHEAMWLHQAMRELAQRLAARGIPVLRFDYLGTGDSVDCAGLLRPTDWADEVLDAVRYMNSVTGVERISLVGFRFGATVAALAARKSESEIESIAMLAPVRSMRLFMREMSVLHQTWRRTAGIGEDEENTPPGARDILGHRFSMEALTALSDLDLCKQPSVPAQRVLIAHSGQRDGSQDLAAHFEANGAAVHSLNFESYAQVLQPAWMTELPEQMLNQAADWLAEGVVSSVLKPTIKLDPNPVIVTSFAVESPLQVEDGSLFGVLCEPALRRAPPEHTPVVLIANTAATHHVGDGRFGVELGRALAQRGFASLRIDARGLGDSTCATLAGIPGHTSLDATGADLSAATDWLAQRGYRNIVVFGICAGAYAALQAARSNRAIRGLVMVNPVGFLLPAGCTMQGAAERRVGSPRAHLRSMVRAKKWAQVIRGDVQLGPVTRTMWRHAVAQMQGMAAAWSGEMLCSATESQQVRKLFQRLDADGVHVRLLFSPRDHSLDELYMHFGVGARRLRKLSRARTLIFHNMDHEVLDRIAREDVMAACDAFLREAFLGAAAEEESRPLSKPVGGVVASLAAHAGASVAKESCVTRDTEMSAHLPRAEKSA